MWNSPSRFWRYAAVLGASVSFACSAPPEERHEVLVRVESDPGVPLPGATIAYAGRELGKSDAQGLVELQLSGPPGARVPLDLRCPPGFQSLGNAPSVVLRPLTDPTKRPEYRAACRPELRSLVVSVRAPNGAGVPLRYLGKEVARTDVQGAAHALLKLAPGENVKLVLDTSDPEHAALLPQNPALQLTMPDRDEVLLFDQPFAIKEQKKPRPRVKRPDLPVRL